MKKIILSLAVIAIVGAITVQATRAYFSDTETSSVNTFTAGAIDLKMDSQAHYNNMVCVNGTWQPENGFNYVVGHYPEQGSVCGITWGQENGLDIVAQKFFDFADLKPGDMGENTISLHVDNNPAWACANITITSDEDVTCTEPENEAEGQGTCAPDTKSVFNGEIGKNLSLAWWADNGDNVLDSEETNTLFFMSGAKLNNLLTAGGDQNNKILKLTLADSLQNFFKNTHPNGGPLNGSQPYYIGLAWCFGDMNINGTTITCNGAPLNNESQTDSLTANMTFMVTQARNQESFRCEDTYKPIPPKSPTDGLN